MSFLDNESFWQELESKTTKNDNAIKKEEKHSGNYLEITNMFEHVDKKYLKKKFIEYPNYDKMKINIPCYMGIIGKSGSMKTNWIFSFIQQVSRFQRIVIVAKDPHNDPLYLDFIDKMRKLEKKHDVDILEIVPSLHEAPTCEDFDPKINNMMIVDDYMLAKNQSNIEELFIRARKVNLTIVYLAQAFFKIPSVIRDQFDYIVLKKVTSMRNLSNILSVYNNIGIDLKQFKKIYNDILKKGEKYGLLIDIKTNDETLRLRCDYTPLFNNEEIKELQANT